MQDDSVFCDTVLHKAQEQLAFGNPAFVAKQHAHSSEIQIFLKKEMLQLEDDEIVASAPLGVRKKWLELEDDVFLASTPLLIGRCDRLLSFSKANLRRNLETGSRRSFVSMVLSLTSVPFLKTFSKEKCGSFFQYSLSENCSISTLLQAGATVDPHMQEVTTETPRSQLQNKKIWMTPSKLFAQNDQSGTVLRRTNDGQGWDIIGTPTPNIRPPGVSFRGSRS